MLLVSTSDLEVLVSILRRPEVVTDKLRQVDDRIEKPLILIVVILDYYP